MANRRLPICRDVHWIGVAAICMDAAGKAGRAGSQELTSFYFCRELWILRSRKEQFACCLASNLLYADFCAESAA